MTIIPPVQLSDEKLRPHQSQEWTLRAMATNYGDGPHKWDYLDKEACAKAADEIRALKVAAGERPVVSVKTMRLSGEKVDYYVSIAIGGRDVTPHVFRERFKAEYHVALYDWLLNGGEEPELMAFGPGEWPARKLGPELASPPATGVRVKAGIYVASKVAHAEMWRDLRHFEQMPIISTWIDEAGPGESADLSDLWRRCIAEASSAAALLIYRRPDEVLKGAWIELGAALASGVPVYAVGIEEFTVAKDTRIRHFPTLVDARAAILSAVE